MKIYIFLILGYLVISGCSISQNNSKSYLDENIKCKKISQEYLDKEYKDSDENSYISIYNSYYSKSYDTCIVEYKNTIYGNDGGYGVSSFLINSISGKTYCNEYFYYGSGKLNNNIDYLYCLDEYSKKLGEPN